MIFIIIIFVALVTAQIQTLVVFAHCQILFVHSKLLLEYE